MKSTYQYLLHASENHMRAFVRNLKRLDIDYKPMVLSEEEFKRITGDKTGAIGRGNSNQCCSDD